MIGPSNSPFKPKTESPPKMAKKIISGLVAKLKQLRKLERRWRTLTLRKKAKRLLHQKLSLEQRMQNLDTRQLTHSQTKDFL